MRWDPRYPKMRDATASQSIRKTDAPQNRRKVCTTHLHRVVLCVALCTALYKANESCSIPVGVALERPRDLDSNVVGLLLGKRGHLSTQSREVQVRHFLIELPREEVDLSLVPLLL